MGRKSKVSSEVKFKVVQEYLEGLKTMSQITYELDINYSTIQEWVRKYKQFGIKGLLTERTNTKYSDEIKTRAINDFYNSNGSLRDICIQYNISSHSILRKWIKQNTCDTINSSYSVKGAVNMNKGRKTTYEERIEIVSFCIANSNDYKLTADKFNVSYQQVYSWIKKYRENGYSALVDRRGKHKTLDELAESEKYFLELKLLKADNRKLKMENDFLKN
ncbi:MULTISPECIES: transposase [unclassified Clostridium]|uniref:transposase n=1 Tax=unclassified Clostridium TaxID=2614128 RepID=UPI00207983E1|nr:MULTISPECIES: transposase [unclassified Clostridium]